MLLRTFVVLLCLSITGCYQTHADRLVGTWQGEPDSTEAAAARSNKKAELQQVELGGEKKLGSAESKRAPEPTDLEAYDVGIKLDFHGDKTVQMSLSDGSEVRQGVWRVVTGLPPSGAEIEISLTADDNAAATEKRRFLVDFENHSDDASATTGFTLREKGADVKFGRLYFSPVTE